MMYSKLFSSLVNSSLWSEPDHIRLLFITLLALADRDGIIYGSRSGLMRAAMIDLDAAKEYDPWMALMSPDDDSSDLMRNPDNEGRRLEEIPGGFRIINYTYYRSLRDSEDRKTQNKKAQQRHREKVSHNKPASATVSHCHDIEIESESKIEKKEKIICPVGTLKGRPKDQKEVESFCVSIGLLASDGEAMWLEWQERGYGKTKDWKAKIRKWKIYGYHPSQKQNKFQKPTKADYKRNYMPPAREPSEEELAKARKIAKIESEKFRAKLQSPEILEA